jgi:hypothetical protein
MPPVNAPLAIATSAVLLAACSNEIERTCEDLCAELVGSCNYEAFPSIESCLQGCLYDAQELGADVVSEFTCVEQAACDLFAIVECEHAYGVD